MFGHPFAPNCREGSLAFVFAPDLVDYGRLRLLGTMWPDLVATFGEEEAAAWWTQLNGILVTEAIQAIPVEWAERLYARTVNAMRQQVRRMPPGALARTG